MTTMKVLKCPCGCHLGEFSKEEVKLKSVCMSCNCAHPLTTRRWLNNPKLLPKYLLYGNLALNAANAIRERERKSAKKEKRVK